MSLAYLAVITHQRNREHQGAALRAQALAVQGLIDPLPAPLPPTRSEVAAAQRFTAVEVAKERWNREIESAVRWAQHTDWNEVREGMEAGASKLYVKAFGESAGQTERAVEKKVVSLAHTAKDKSEDAAKGIAAAARGAFDKASQAGAKLETKTEDTAYEARIRAKSAAITAKEGLVVAEDTAKEKATEAKGVFASALDRGKEMVGLAKSRVDMAEDKFTVKADGQVLPSTTPVQKALHQRYERPEAKHNKTVADVLQERYTPVDKRDNTVLRGV